MQSTILSFLILLLACSSSSKETTLEIKDNNTLIDSSQISIISRFNPPKNFETVTSDSSSFGFYLQHLPLRPIDEKVKYYSGDTKPMGNTYCSVVDMEIDPVDLQQCADAVMRLRGEYLYHQKKYSSIHFNFLSDGKPRYFNDYAKGDYSYVKFRKYMKYILSCLQ